MRLLFTHLSILAGYLAAGCQSGSSPDLVVFESDGCTCFPNGTLKAPDLWVKHCRTHDYFYWKGGTRKERKEADLRFREGIRSEGKPVIARLAYAGVRIGGTPWFPTGWRWGFGWKAWPRGYRGLTGEEKQLVRKTGPDPPDCESAQLRP